MTTRLRSNSVGLGVPSSSTVMDSSSDDDTSSSSALPSPVNGGGAGALHHSPSDNDMAMVHVANHHTTNITIRTPSSAANSYNNNGSTASSSALSSSSHNSHGVTGTASNNSTNGNKRSTSSRSTASICDQLFELVDHWITRWRRQSLCRRYIWFVTIWFVLTCIIVTLITVLGLWPASAQYRASRAISAAGRTKLWKWLSTHDDAPGSTPLWKRALAMEGPYRPEWTSLQQHTIPEWYDNAKLGIFIHWGLYSVPAWAPPVGIFGEIDWSSWFKNCAYAEWYYNTMTIADSPTMRHHNQTYGDAYHYTSFADTFNREIQSWDADEMAAIIADSGARYTVLTTKHHEGFTLWPSKVKTDHWYLREKKRRVNPVRHASRNIVKELSDAVRARGLRSGVYYSGGLDWSWYHRPIEAHHDLQAPFDKEYPRFAEAHVMELIDMIQPDVLWNDIGWGFGDLRPLFSLFYNTNPSGVVNNRWNTPEHSDFTTPEYSAENEITSYKWESTRGLGFSFGYNRIETAAHTIARHRLVELLIDVVSRNGNLLLNIGPMANGTIHSLQRDRLSYLGTWLRTYGPAIYDTRPWHIAQVTSVEGSKVVFTHRPLHDHDHDHTEALFMIVFPRRDGDNDAIIRKRETIDETLAVCDPLPSSITLPSKYLRAFASSSNAVLLTPSKSSQSPKVKTKSKDKVSAPVATKMKLSVHPSKVAKMAKVAKLAKNNKRLPLSTDNHDHNDDDHTHNDNDGEEVNGMPLVMSMISSNNVGFLSRSSTSVRITLPSSSELQRLRPLQSTAPIAIMITKKART